MPLNSPDFSKCNEKKCSTSAGVIFNCDNPCEGGADFSYDTGRCAGDPEFSPQSTWAIDYLAPFGSNGGASCLTCEPGTGVGIGTKIVDFGTALVVPLEALTVCSFAEACSNGPSNCGTYKEITGADYVLVDTTYFNGDQDSVCGQSDTLYQKFLLVSGGNFAPDSIIAYQVASAWLGTVGCCLPQRQVLEVRTP